MTKRNHDLLRDVLDELAATPIYTAACARCGISTKSLWRYVRASQREDDPENYRLLWCDVEDWFHNHLRQAMRMSALMIEATARHHALNGFAEVQTFQGKLCWQEDPKLAGLSDDELARLGLSDRYARNPDGSLIPLTVRRKPSDQLVLKMLAAHFPRTYGDKVVHEHGGIINMIIGRDGKMRPIAPPRALEDRSDELVVSADAGDAEASRMRIGLVVGEPLNQVELEREFGGEQPIQEVEFETIEAADDRVTELNSADQQSAASAQEPAPVRRGGAANPADRGGPTGPRPPPGGYRVA